MSKKFLTSVMLLLTTVVFTAFGFPLRAAALVTLDPNKSIALLPPPSDLKAAVSATEVDLYWLDNSTTEDGFKIWRYTSGGSYTEIASVGADSTSYRDRGSCVYLVSGLSCTGLLPGTYYYKVQAYTNTAASDFSGEASVTVEDTPAASLPKPPTNLLAVATSGTSVSLRWSDNSTDENGFVIERESEGSSYVKIGSTAPDATHFADTGLTAGAVYYYRVKAYNAAGDSPYSNEEKVVLTGSSLPAAPKNLLGLCTSPTSVSLQWSDNSTNEEGFKVERMTEGGSFIEIGTAPANSAHFADSGLTSGAVYCYRVRAYNATGDSPYSNEAKVVLSGLTLPAAPQDLSALGTSSTSVSLRWSDNSTNEEGFKVERMTEGGSFIEIGTAPVNSTHFADSGLTTGTTYYYRVRAYNATGYSSYSNEEKVKLTSTPTSMPVRLRIGSTGYHVWNQMRAMDVAPVIMNNRTLLPIRYVAESLGADVSWDPVQRMATVVLGPKRVELWEGRNTARVNGQNVLIDPKNPAVTPLTLPPGRTMMPLRFIAESLGCQVDWNADLKEATVIGPNFNPVSVIGPNT